MEQTVVLLDHPKRPSRSDADVRSAFLNNETLTPDEKTNTMQVKRKFPEATIQQCWVALLMARGDVEKAEEEVQVLINA